MTHRWSAGLAFILLVAIAIAVPHGAAGQTAPARIPVPVFDVDPSWPKPLPNNWTFGQFAGVHVDSRDHIWIVQRPRTLEPDENALTITPPPADCCAPAPPVMEFDMAGNFIQGWGGPGTGYDWPENEHGVFVDHNDNVWVGGNGPNDHHVLKFTRTGTFVMQIGRPGMSKGSNDTDNLNRPAQIFVVPSTNEAFIADGYGNRRVIVFDADTGRYKRHWGAYGARPDDEASNTAGAGGRCVEAVQHAARRAGLARRDCLCGGPREQPHSGLQGRRHLPERGLHRTADGRGRASSTKWIFHRIPSSDSSTSRTAAITIFGSWSGARCGCSAISLGRDVTRASSITPTA